MTLNRPAFMLSGASVPPFRTAGRQFANEAALLERPAPLELRDLQREEPDAARPWNEYDIAGMHRTPIGSPSATGGPQRQFPVTMWTSVPQIPAHAIRSLTCPARTTRPAHAMPGSTWTMSCGLERQYFQSAHQER
jgi:hypothetical protein